MDFLPPMPSVDGIKRLHQIEHFPNEIKELYLQYTAEIFAFSAAVEELFAQDEFYSLTFMQKLKILKILKAHAKTMKILNQLKWQFDVVQQGVAHIASFCKENDSHQFADDDLSVTLMKYQALMSNYERLIKQFPYPEISNIVNNPKISFILNLEKNSLLKMLSHFV